MIVGFAVDYGFWLLERQRLQNAVDAASLAGARALVDGASPGIDAARATTLDYLSRHGYVTDANTAVDVSFPVGAGGMIESVAVDVDRTRDTFFVRLVGVDEVELGAQATAAVDRRMIDIMLSIDLTGSMELSGSGHLASLQDAVEAFVNMIDPSTSDPLGPKIGIARFAGVMCQWYRQDNDLWIDVRTQAPNNAPSEYRLPCADDKTVVSPLTFSKATLLRIADDVPGAPCPPGQSQYACPLRPWPFQNPTVQASPGGGQVTPNGMWRDQTKPGSGGGQEVCLVSCGMQPDLTGTKLPNGITVVNNSYSTANGGRNDPATGVARKVLVMITDGQNELWPTIGHPIGNPSVWNDEARLAAAALKKGMDGIAGTADDVEIYTVGYFCKGTGHWCVSELVDAHNQPRPCPGQVTPGLDDDGVDQLLIDISSSAPGACDRYFPIAKGENLPLLFQTIAGAITRGRLTQ